MSLQAYYDNIQAKTGKTPQDFKALAEKKGFLRAGTKTGQIVEWLKQDYGLGRGHAMAIVLSLQSATQPRVSQDEQITKLFRGDRAKWRKTYDQLLARVLKFGPDVSVDPTNSYISLLRAGKKFAVVQVTAERFDIGIKRKGTKPTDRFQPAGAWNGMVTHRVQVHEPKEMDAQVMTWLKAAFDEAYRSRVSAR